jgi:hypothetical protein
MQLKCIKNNLGTPSFADITIGDTYIVYDVWQHTVYKEYLIKDDSNTKKWYSESLFEVV